MHNTEWNRKRTALITGTTSGIGHELAAIFAREGFNLVLVSRNHEKLNAQKDDLKKKHAVDVYTYAIDLSKQNAAEEVFSEMLGQGLPIDVLINNAGFNESGPFYETSLERELKMLQVHITTLTHMTKLFLPGMIKNGYGRILNLGSTGSFTPCALDAVYCASKAYVLSFSSALRAELAGTGVTVSTLCPGATKTEFAGKAHMENTALFKRFVMEPRKVAEAAYAGLMKNKKIIVPGFYNRILVSSIPYTPGKILDKVSVYLLRRRTA